ncbi:hypothetical protein LCGC14_2929410 [marine sediment metagenome]|uniref:Uncharacterized protein n=1 Tax=marine sediment metagenome TaxID=412755 RepID=A0A0F8Y892_9ZZZZ
MRRAFVVYIVLATIGFLSLDAYMVRAETSDEGQPRIAAGNRGLQARVTTLEGLVTTLEGLVTTLQGQVQTQEGLVTALQAKQAVLVTGQVFDYRIGYEQMAAQIIEAGLEAETWMIWVCAPSEPTGEKQITRDQFITNAGIVNARRDTQIAALLADD